MGTEPVWAVAVGVGLGGEHLTPVILAGAVLVVAATYYGQHVERRHRLGLPRTGAGTLVEAGPDLIKPGRAA